MRRRLKWIFIGIVLVAALLQLTNPSRTNPPILPGHAISPTNAPPPQIAALLHTACYNCHSQETQWPWYSHIAPVSWLIARDVNAGRARMNFSDWPNDHPDQAAKRLGDLSEEVHNGDMPPSNYQWMHPEARLTPAQRDELVKWADQEADRLRAAGGK